MELWVAHCNAWHPAGCGRGHGPPSSSAVGMGPPQLLSFTARTFPRGLFTQVFPGIEMPQLDAEPIGKKDGDLAQSGGTPAGSSVCPLSGKMEALRQHKAVLVAIRVGRNWTQDLRVPHLVGLAWTNWKAREESISISLWKRQTGPYLYSSYTLGVGVPGPVSPVTGCHRKASF